MGRTSLGVEQSFSRTWYMANGYYLVIKVRKREESKGQETEADFSTSEWVFNVCN